MDAPAFLDPLSLPARPRISFDCDFSDSDSTVIGARLWDSRLGGAPYRPLGTDWPRQPDGTPLGFLAQINLVEVEQWRRRHNQPEILDGQLPTTGMLQFFLPLTDGWGLWGGGDCLVVHHPDVGTGAAALEPPLVAVTADDGVELVPEVEQPVRYPARLARDGRTLRQMLRPFPADAWHTTPLTQSVFPFRLYPTLDQPTVQRGHPAVDPGFPESLREMFAAARGDERHRATIEDFHERFAGRGGIQLGGYPYFTQEDPRPLGDSRVLLFQLDSVTAAVGIGDSGVINFFIDPADLARRDFTRVSMNWDCC